MALYIALIFFILLFSFRVYIIITDTKPKREHCDYCNSDYIVKHYGKSLGFYKERNGRLIKDDSFRVCYFHHSNLLSIKNKLDKQNKKNK